MSCSDCSFRDRCKIREEYQMGFDEENIERLRELEDKIELHEAYISEMRTELQKRIIKQIERNP